MLKMIITVGISNSGKTTFAEKYLEEYPTTMNINRDYERLLISPDMNLQKYKYTKQREKTITATCIGRAKAAKRYGYDIIISDTNLNSKTRRFWSQWAGENGYEFEVKWFPISLRDALVRNSKRDYSIPEGVIKRQYRTYQELTGGFQYKADHSLPEAVVFDIDGTLADMQKGKKEGRSPYDWDKVGNDILHLDVVNYLRMCYHSGQYKVLLLTGRDGCCLQLTKDWLDDWQIPYDDIWIRTEGDPRPDYVIKQEIFEEHIAPFYNVIHVVDDRKMMVDAWQGMNVRVWSVGQADNDF